MISLVILIIVFVLIAIREIEPIRIKFLEVTLMKVKIWEAMLLGAIGVLITGQISFRDAVASINLDVIIFLFCMFIIGVALEESGYLEYLSFHIFRRAKNKDQVLLILTFVMGFFSAILMNDTIAIIGTPIIIHLAKKGFNIKPLLLGLAFSITIGSLTSPVGNPQNFLIAGQLPNPFVNFLKYLFLPTLINLFFSYLVIRCFFRNDLKGEIDTKDFKEDIKDENLANLGKISIILLIILIFLKIVLSIITSEDHIPLLSIVIIASLPVLIFNKNRLNIIKKIDWHTLIFFASMFILMQSVWNSGIFQHIIKNLNFNLYSIFSIFVISIVISQFISNVPLVILYMPLILDAGGVKELMALAAGSTIAGNLLILGAASNVIVIHNAEKRAGVGINFFEFAKVGIPLTIINTLVYLFFLYVF